MDRSEIENKVVAVVKAKIDVAYQQVSALSDAGVSDLLLSELEKLSHMGPSTNPAYVNAMVDRLTLASACMARLAERLEIVVALQSS